MHAARQGLAGNARQRFDSPVGRAYALDPASSSTPTNARYRIVCAINISSTRRPQPWARFKTALLRRRPLLCVLGSRFLISRQHGARLTRWIRRRRFSVYFRDPRRGPTRRDRQARGRPRSARANGVEVRCVGSASAEFRRPRGDRRSAQPIPPASLECGSPPANPADVAALSRHLTSPGVADVR